MRRQIIGYIVLNKNGALLLCPSPGERGSVLLHGYAATVFDTRRHARTAIKRTRAYAHAHHYNWDLNHSIVRLI